MHQGDFSHPIEICDHLTARPDGFGLQRAGAVFHDDFLYLPGLDLSGHPSIESTPDLLFGYTPPRRNTQCPSP